MFPDVGGRVCAGVQKSQEHSSEEFLHHLTAISECCSVMPIWLLLNEPADVAFNVYSAVTVHNFHLLPLPRRLCFCHCLFLCFSVCLLAKTSKWICMKFSGKVGSGLVNIRLNFGGNLDHHRL